MENGCKQAPITKRLEGKVALITGGASGIGEATARLFVSHGAKVMIADIQDHLGHSICKGLGLDERVSFVHCDVTEEMDVKNAVDTAISLYGKLDIMFNNAGIGGAFGGSIVNAESEDFKKVFEVNAYGSFLGAKHAARVMIPEKRGTIIFTASGASVIAGGVPLAYLMSKHAVVGMCKSLCVELGEYGIRVNCVSPYLIATPMVMALMDDKDVIKAEELFSSSSNLKGVVLRAEDVAEAVLYLASDEAKYVNGHNLVVDGGFTTTNPSFPIAAKPVT